MQFLEAGHSAGHADAPQRIENLVEDGWNYLSHHKLAVATTVAGTALGLFALKKVLAEDAVEVAASIGQAGKPLLELGGELTPAELKSLGMNATTRAGENLLAESPAAMRARTIGVPDRPIDTEPRMRTIYSTLDPVGKPGMQTAPGIKQPHIELPRVAPTGKISVPDFQSYGRGVPDLQPIAEARVVIPSSSGSSFSSGGALAAFGRGLRVMSVLRLIS